MYQLVVAQRIDSCAWCEPNQKPGNVIWVRDENAVRHLLENGLCRWPTDEDAKQYGPSQAKPFGPAEVKTAGADSRPKFSGEAMAGRTIASPLSSRRGAAALSCASAAALVLPHRL